MADLAIIKNKLELVRPDFEKLNLNGLNFFKEIEFAMQIFGKNSYLAGADPQTMMNAIKNVAMTGLTLNPVLKYCYLIPRFEKINGQKVLCCVAEPSYVGLCKILTDTGSVAAISSTMVYEKEIQTLSIQEGANGHAKHLPFFKGHPGQAMACYTKAILPSGIEFIGLIRPFQWEDISKRSESVKSYYAKVAKGEYAPIPTWVSDLDEMIRKTAIKNIYKYLPKTERAELIGNAIQMDNVVNGINFDEPEKPETINDTLDTTYEEIVTDNIPEAVATEVMNAPSKKVANGVWNDHPELHEFPEFAELLKKRHAEIDLAIMQHQAAQQTTPQEGDQNGK